MGDKLRTVRAAVATALRTEPAILAAQRLCRTCVSVMGVSGAALCLADGVSGYRLLGASDRRAAELSEAQFATGWGPGPDALSAGAAVLAEDLAAPSVQQRWPFFAPLAVSAGMRAVHSMPVVIGVDPAGTLDLYGTRPMPPTSFRLEAAQLVADAAVEAIMRLCTSEGRDPADGVLWSQRDSDFARIHQASGMLAERFGISPSESLLRMRARAFCDGVSMAVLARRIVEQRQWPED